MLQLCLKFSLREDLSIPLIHVGQVNQTAAIFSSNVNHLHNGREFFELFNPSK